MVSPTAERLHFDKSFWSVLRSSARYTSAWFPWIERPQILLNLPGSHQSLRGLLRNLLRNPVEPDLAAPKPPRPSPEPSSEPSPEPCWTWPGSAPKPPKPSPEPSEPFPEPRWTWPGSCTSAHRSYSGLKTPLACAVGEKSIFPILSHSHWIYHEKMDAWKIPCAFTQHGACKVRSRWQHLLRHRIEDDVAWSGKKGKTTIDQTTVVKLWNNFMGNDRWVWEKIGKSMVFSNWKIINEDK